MILKNIKINYFILLLLFSFIIGQNNYNSNDYYLLNNLDLDDDTINRIYRICRENNSWIYETEEYFAISGIQYYKSNDSVMWIMANKWLNMNLPLVNTGAQANSTFVYSNLLKWPQDNGKYIIAYKFDNNLNGYNKLKNRIEDIMREWELGSKIKFVPKSIADYCYGDYNSNLNIWYTTCTDFPYFTIRADTNTGLGSVSSIGRVSGEQLMLNLNPGLLQVSSTNDYNPIDNCQQNPFDCRFLSGSLTFNNTNINYGMGEYPDVIYPGEGILLENNNNQWKASTNNQNISLSRFVTVLNVVIRHELGHIIGYPHEHQKWNRNNFVTFTNEINLDTNSMHYIVNYGIIPRNITQELMTNYDYDSIMHYSYFRRNDNNEYIWTPINISPKDRTSLNILYP